MKFAILFPAVQISRRFFVMKSIGKKKKLNQPTPLLCSPAALE
jgi:hypothetical protein